MKVEKALTTRMVVVETFHIELSRQEVEWLDNIICSYQDPFSCELHAALAKVLKESCQ